MRIIQGIFDGTAVRPLEAVSSNENQRVSILIDTDEETDPVMNIFGMLSHEEAENLRNEHLAFRGEV